MKSTLLMVTLAFACIFCACRKEQQTPDAPQSPITSTGKKQLVEFKLPAFIQEVKDMRTSGRLAQAATLRDSALVANAPYLYYVVYDSLGYALHSFTQNAWYDADFGTIRDSLPPGNYTVVLTAAGMPNLVNPGIPLSDAGIQLPGPDSIGNRAPVTDTYFKRFSFSVFAGSPATSTDVVLDRVVGKLEVNILDAPVNNGLNELSVSILPEASFFSFGSGTSIVMSQDSILWFARQESPTKFTMYVMNTEVPLNVFIRHTGYYTGITHMKIVSARCYKNKRTILTGNLMDATDPGAGSSFKVSVNDAWDPNDEVIDF